MHYFVIFWRAGHISMVIWLIMTLNFTYNLLVWMWNTEILKAMRSTKICWRKKILLRTTTWRTTWRQIDPEDDNLTVRYLIYSLWSFMKMEKTFFVFRRKIFKLIFLTSFDIVFEPHNPFLYNVASLHLLISSTMLSDRYETINLCLMSCATTAFAYLSSKKYPPINTISKLSRHYKLKISSICSTKETSV